MVANVEGSWLTKVERVFLGRCTAAAGVILCTVRMAICCIVCLARERVVWYVGNERVVDQKACEV